MALTAVAILMLFHLSQYDVKAQLTTNEALSSPNHINVKKNSAIWLHWNYTYNLYGGLFSYENQQIKVNDTILNQLTVVAEKIGENGLLQVKSGLSSEWMNKLTAFGNNNTLMVKNMEYNDSTKLFQSKVNMRVVANNAPSPYILKPSNISISVTGEPEYLTAPPSKMEIAENSNFMMVVRFDGNPKPSGELQWSHQSSKTAMLVEQEYPYSYKGTYQLGSISSSYCGRVLTTKLSNSVGSAADKTTTVTVLLNLDASPNLRAGKPNQSCVQVTWQKKESGLCNVNYAVKFKNASGVTLYQESGNNIAEVVKCGISSNVNVTGVELVMTSTKKSKSFTAIVQQSPLPPPTTIPPTTTPESSQTSPKSQSNASVSTGSVEPTGTTLKPPTSSSNMGVIIGGSVGGLVFLIIIIVVVCCVIKKSKNHPRDTDSGEPDYPLADKKDNVYASAGGPDPSRGYEHTYADPNQKSLIYGKLGEGGGRKGPRPSKKEPEQSDYADVKVDEHGYPAVGAVPISYTDGYRSKAPSSSSSRGDSGRRVAPEKRREPPPYTDPKLDEDGYPASRNIPPVYAQVNKPRKYR